MRSRDINDERSHSFQAPKHQTTNTKSHAPGLLEVEHGAPVAVGGAARDFHQGKAHLRGPAVHHLDNGVSCGGSDGPWFYIRERGCEMKHVSGKEDTAEDALPNILSRI